MVLNVLKEFFYTVSSQTYNTQENEKKKDFEKNGLT